MATMTMEIKRLRREVGTLKKRVTRLERREFGGKRKAAPKRTASQRDRVREILRQSGMLAELTPEEKARAAEWRALPEAEKQRVRDELWNLKLSQPLSQIIIENR